MHFCKVCENMYYIRLKDDDSNSLIYYCRKLITLTSKPEVCVDMILEKIKFSN